ILRDRERLFAARGRRDQQSRNPPLAGEEGRSVVSSFDDLARLAQERFRPPPPGDRDSRDDRQSRLRRRWATSDEEVRTSRRRRIDVQRRRPLPAHLQRREAGRDAPAPDADPSPMKYFILLLCVLAGSARAENEFTISYWCGPPAKFTT